MARRGRPPHPDILTPREWEVLDLLRQGLSNPEIAERLGVSRAGAKYHVAEILSKLGVGSREEAARWSLKERPWWAAAVAPFGLFGRRALGALGVGVVGAAIAGLVLLAFLLLRGDSDSDSDALPALPHELAYVSGDGSLVVMNIDSGERRVLSEDVGCGSPRLEWSPGGETLACMGDNRIVLRGMSDTTYRQIDVPIIGDPEKCACGLIDFAWSPSGQYFVYLRYSLNGFAMTIEDSAGDLRIDLDGIDPRGVGGHAAHGFPLWSADETKLAYRSDDLGVIVVYRLDSRAEETLPELRYPLAWALDGTAIIAGQADPEGGLEEPISPFFETVLIDATTGEALRLLPELDHGRDFWVAPDGVRVVYVTRDERSDGLPGLGVLDLRTGEGAPIEDSLITYGGDQIPGAWVSFSDDGEEVYWVGGDNAGYRARLDGGHAEKLVELENQSEFAWSQDRRRIAYIAYGTDAVSLVVASGNGSDVDVIEERLPDDPKFVSAWRPKPQVTPP